MENTYKSLFPPELFLKYFNITKKVLKTKIIIKLNKKIKKGIFVSNRMKRVSFLGYNRLFFSLTLFSNFEWLRSIFDEKQEFY